METQAKENSFLGEVPVGKLLLKFSIPCVISLLITALYNIVDQIFVGNSTLGYLGNAATGIVFPLLIITQAFAWCFGDGCAAYLAIAQGRKDTSKAARTIGTTMIATLAVSVILMVVAFFCKEPILRLFGASDQTIDMAKEYLTILCFFFPLYMLQNMMSPVIRADGSPIFSMICLGAGAIINIILDPIMINSMGIAGAAWATVIGQIVSFLITAAYFFKPKSFKFGLKAFLPDFKEFGKASIMGISSFITQISIVAISLACNIMLAKYGATSKYGQDIPISIISVETKVFTVLINIVVGIVLGGQPILGYNIGAKKIDRVHKTYRLILIFSVAIALTFTLVNEVFPDAFILPFGDGGASHDLYMDYGRKTFRIFLMFVTFTCLIKMTSIFFQSVGKPVHAAAVSLSRDIVCFIPLAILIPFIAEGQEAGSGITALLWAAPISDSIAFVIAIVLTALYFRGLSKTEPIKKEPASGETINGIMPSKPGMLITIAREHGSKGKAVGEMIAKELGIPFYDKAIMAMVAEKSGLSEQYIIGSKERSAVVSSLYLTKEPSQIALDAEKEILNKIADQGAAVIVGRAANLLLKDRENLVSLFLYASAEVRIENLMEMYGDTRAEAAKNIKSSDRSRAAYCEFVSSGKWGDMHQYDACFCLDKGKEESAKAILEYLKNL